MFAGDPARSIRVVEANLRLDPFPTPLSSSGLMGLANYMLKHYEESVRLLQECTSQPPDALMAHLWLAAAYAKLGQLDEARVEAAEVLRINPGFTIGKWKRILVAHKNPEDADHRVDGLRKAGLPEA
jgi:adenylate cyclase